MDKQFEVDNSILVFAMRYAMGRESYAPKIVIENIEHNLGHTSSNVVTLMMREIDEYSHGICDTHTDRWLSLRVVLEAELRMRSVSENTIIAKDKYKQQNC